MFDKRSENGWFDLNIGRNCRIMQYGPETVLRKGHFEDERTYFIGVGSALP